MLADLRSIISQFVSNAPILELSEGLTLLSDHSVTGASVADPFESNANMKRVFARYRICDMVSPAWRVRITVPNRIPYRFRLGICQTVVDDNFFVIDYRHLYPRGILGTVTGCRTDRRYLNYANKYGAGGNEGWRTFGWADGPDTDNKLTEWFTIPTGERSTVWEFRADLSNAQLSIAIDGKKLQKMRVRDLALARPVIELALPETTATFLDAD